MITIVKTRDDESIQQFITEYLSVLDKELEQCHEKLTIQSACCPPTLSLQPLDTSLREFVCLHQRRFFKKMHCQLAKVKAGIRDRELWQQLSTYQLNIEQVEDNGFCATSDLSIVVCLSIQLEAIDRLITLQQQQRQVLEELFMLEQRVLCQFLPKSFDHITLDNLNLTMNAGDIELPVKQKTKRLQQLKRTMLNHLIQTYETTIVDYEHQYRQEMVKLEQNSLSDQHVNGSSLIDSIKTYLINRTHQIKSESSLQMDKFHNDVFLFL